MSTITYDDDNLIKFTQLGLEDLFWGEGSQTVVRFGEEYVITDINAGNMPFDASRTLQEVLDDQYPSVEIVGNDIASVVTVANDISSVVEVATDPLKTAILDAGSNAVTAQLEAWNAIAAQMTADSYAVEPVDVFVKIYTSNDDGTYTATDTTDYSALHWATKASPVDVGDISWGEITGTLSAQTDLQNALNLKLNVADPTFTGKMTGPEYLSGDYSWGDGGLGTWHLNRGNDFVINVWDNSLTLALTSTNLTWGGTKVLLDGDIDISGKADTTYVNSENDAQDLLIDNKVNSVTTADAGAKVIENMVEITQADYDALTPNANTVYFIVG